jgi:hypothetical protein
MKLETNGVDPVEPREDVAREKISLLPVGLLALILAPVIIVASLFSENVTTSKFSIDRQKEIKILVIIKASEFLTYSTKNVCDGSGEIAGLWRSEVQIKTSDWVRTAALGRGILNSDGACEYRLQVTPPAEFEGGKVTASAILPLGKAADAVGDTGNGTSFKLITLTYNLG